MNSKILGVKGCGNGECVLDWEDVGIGIKSTYSTWVVQFGNRKYILWVGGCGCGCAYFNGRLWGWRVHILE